MDDLSPYLQAIRQHPPLGRDEEHAVALRASRGDVAARQKLARHNLAFVVAIARRQRRGSVRLDDLIQEGNVGLMKAVEKFDAHAGTRFSTYAVWWIRAYVGKYLKEVRSAVRPISGTVAQADGFQKVFFPPPVDDND
jgi:RNA polymerase primary sigma factor